jgi:hypothetical protein
MLILVILGMYFDAVVVFVTSQTKFFRLALAILWVLKIELERTYYFMFQSFIETVSKGTFYLESADEMWNRHIKVPKIAPEHLFLICP